MSKPKNITEKNVDDDDMRQRGIAVARRIHQEGSDNQIEIDDNAKLTTSDHAGGFWCQAWVWVSDDDFNPEE